MLDTIIEQVSQDFSQRKIRARYQRLHGHDLPDNPTTFTGKLFQRMLKWDISPPLQAQAWTDKHEAKEKANYALGPGHTAKLYWKGTDPRNIPFGELPLPHVIKARHGSRMNLVAREDLDQLDIIEQADKWMQRNYYNHAREGQYRFLTKGLMIEECLQPMQGPLLDYKFWCFHGEPAVVHVDNPDQSINPFFDMQWSLLDLHYRPGCPRPALPKPASFGRMKEIARELSKGIDFVRVDLWDVDGRVYFSEMTYTPNAGGMHFLPAQWDRQLGKWWDLTKEELCSDSI